MGVRLWHTRIARILCRLLHTFRREGVGLHTFRREVVGDCLEVVLLGRKRDACVSSMWYLDILHVRERAVWHAWV